MDVPACSGARWSVMNRPLYALAFVAALAACSKSTPKDGTDGGDGVTTTSAKDSAKAALIEAFGAGSIAWTIDDNGKIRAEIRDKDNANISKNASGTAEWDGGNAKLVYDDGAKALVGSGPALKADITPVKYAITGGPEPMTGTLQVPIGGTQALVSDSKSDAVDAGSTTGPNGGIVQVVGDDRIEIVADKDSDEVRVYVLDASGKPVAPGDRKITLAVNGDANEVVVLSPSSDGVYLVGNWKTKTDPNRITVSVRRGSTVHVAIVGWHPGVKLMVVGGPKWNVHVKDKGWKKVEIKHEKKDDDDDHGHGRGHDNGKHKGH
jgi:hypothetical protein